MVEDVRRRATAVFGESTACGYVLGLVAGFAVVLIGGLVERGGDFVIVVLYSPVYAGIGGGFGLVLGLLGGFVLYVLVRLAEPRFGARTVARLMPVVGLCMTIPLTIAIGLWSRTSWIVIVPAVVSALTLGGTLVIARRYLRRIEAPAVH